MRPTVPGWTRLAALGRGSRGRWSPPTAARASPGTSGSAIDTWVGDGDSIDDGALASLAASGVTVSRVAEAKDESDTELAVLEALGVERTRS